MATVSKVKKVEVAPVVAPVVETEMKKVDVAEVVAPVEPTKNELARALMARTIEAQEAYEEAKQAYYAAEAAYNRAQAAWGPVLSELRDAYAVAGEYSEEYCAPIVQRFVSGLRDQLGAFVADFVIPRLELDGYSMDTVEPDHPYDADVVEYAKTIDSRFASPMRRQTEVLASLVAHVGAMTGGDKGIVSAAQAVCVKLAGRGVVPGAGASVGAGAVRGKREFVAVGRVNLPGYTDPDGGLVIKLHKTVKGTYSHTYGGASRSYYLERIGVESSEDVVNQLEVIGAEWARAQIEALGL